jgi:hypothetical protein
MWEVGRVCPIFKSGDRSLINNYRPVTILSNISKLFEPVLYRFIYQMLSVIFLKVSMVLSFRVLRLQI